MKLLNEYMVEYRKQLEIGSIPKAYKGLMEYIMGLRTHFQKKYPNLSVPSNIYYGYMDMTYFSIVPKSLASRKLKIAVVFLHDQFRFEVWLAGYNKQVQSKYWKLINDSNWRKYHVVSTTQGADSIIEYVVVDSPNFNDLEVLTAQIEKGTMKFIEDIEDFIKVH